MDTKLVEPYTKIWFSCVKNLLLSILQSVDEKYKYIACNNEYFYENKVVPTDNCNFTMLEIHTTWSNVGDMDSMKKNVRYVDFESEEQFFDTVIDSLNKGKCFFAGVDLYYWIEENFCYGKDHWLHSTLIQKYDEEKEMFYVFDVGDDKNYGIFTIGKKEFLIAVREGFARQEKSYYCDIDTKIDVDNITIGMIKENTKKLIDNIAESISKEYFWMKPIDYEEKSYADLNYVFLGRIAQRHSANLMMIEELFKRRFIGEEITTELCKIEEELSQGWLSVQCRVYMLYLQDDLKNKIEKINIKMKNLFSKEQEMWKKFYRVIEERNDEEIVFGFN